MSENLSRRTFLKAAAFLATSGVLAWKSDDPKIEAAEMIEGQIEIEGPQAEIEQPFAPYYLGRGLVWQLDVYQNRDGTLKK